MKQKEMILEWIDRDGYITPARMGGKIFIASDKESYIFPSQGDKRCREMRAAGILASSPDDKDKKFEKFYRAEKMSIPQQIQKDIEQAPFNTNNNSPILNTLFEMPQRKSFDSLTGESICTN